MGLDRVPCKRMEYALQGKGFIQAHGILKVVI